MEVVSLGQKALVYYWLCIDKSVAIMMDESMQLYCKSKRLSNDISMDASMIIEKTMAVTKVDDNGNKYINQYKILGKLGK